MPFALHVKHLSDAFALASKLNIFAIILRLWRACQREAFQEIQTIFKVVKLPFQTRNEHTAIADPESSVTTSHCSKFFPRSGRYTFKNLFDLSSFFSHIAPVERMANVGPVSDFEAMSFSDGCKCLKNRMMWHCEFCSGTDSSVRDGIAHLSKWLKWVGQNVPYAALCDLHSVWEDVASGEVVQLVCESKQPLGVDVRYPRQLASAGIWTCDGESSAGTLRETCSRRTPAGAGKATS